MRRPRVLLADDHTLVLEGLAQLIGIDFDLVGKVGDGRALLEAAHRLAPDVVVMDIAMPHLNGLDSARQLMKVLPCIKVIFLTMHADPEYAREAVRLGASGFLLKRSAVTELTQAIHAALRGEFYLTSAIAKDVLSSLKMGEGEADSPKFLPRSLTARQREVLQLIAEGHTTKAMASILHVSPKTIEFHRTQIMKVLDLHTTAELTRYALSHGLASCE
jgi:DNA-binding NarL/FixJ family response regulator